jgi:hypothetical protein
VAREAEDAIVVAAKSHGTIFYFSMTEEVFFPLDALGLLLAVLFPVLPRACTRFALLQIFHALAFYWPPMA